MPKRKSYCDGRRRSRSIGGYATNGFSELIDPSLPSDTRLQKLLEHTFEHCILVAQREFSVKDNYDSKGIECWKKIKTEIDNRALCSAAASENTDQGNKFRHLKSNSNVLHLLDTHAFCRRSTEDFKTAEVLKSCDKEIKRYEEESRKWNSLVARLREELTEEVEATPSIIESDLDINEPLFDYSTVIKEQASILTDINYKTQEMLKRSKILSSCLRLNKHYREQLFVNARLLLNLESHDTPRRTIKNIVINDKKCFHKFKR